MPDADTRPSDTDPVLVLATLAAVLELPLPSADPSAALIGFLRDKQILLVLDSCEHVVDAVAMLSEVVLDGAPAVRILATSREPLRTPSEYIHRLSPLELPPETAHVTSEEALSFSAIQLFVARAGKALTGFGLTDANTEAVVGICRKLDGMPLPIELATSRIDVLGVSGLLTRLDDRLRLLSHGQRAARSRHRTLHATLAWSYDFLDTRRGARASIAARLMHRGPSGRDGDIIATWPRHGAAKAHRKCRRHLMARDPYDLCRAG